LYTNPKIKAYLSLAKYLIRGFGTSTILLLLYVYENGGCGKFRVRIGNSIVPS
jgi:hypothetical protein